MSSYQVIARKWRPGIFDEVVGQVHVTRTLRNAIASGKVAHAYLFSGPRGVGKTTAARILAKCLNCSSGPTINPCNECSSCKGIASGSYVDVFEIDGASNNGVENVREISESVRYVPSQGKYKVYIIDEVHMLSIPAFNALLKTLEEPPPHAIFIFATTEVRKIPATILSRCQRFDFKRIPLREIQARLNEIATQEKVRFEEKALYLIAREADGSMRDSQSLLEQALAFAGGDLKEADVAEALGLLGRSVLYELSEAIIGKDARACLNIVEKVYNFGYDFKRGCSDLLEHIRDLSVLKATGDSSLLDLPDSEIERLCEISARVSLERLHMLFTILSKGYEDVSRSAHPRYALEMMLLRAAHLDELEPVSALVERLEGVASRLGSPSSPVRPSVSAPQPQPKGLPWKSGGPAKAAAEEGSGAPMARPVKSAAPPEEKKAQAAAQEGREDGGPLGFLKNRNKELYELLKDASIEAVGDSVNITAAARAGAKLTVNRGSLEACLKEFYGAPVSVRINGAGGAGEVKKKDTDPVLKDALRILGGRIIEDRRRTDV
ncbi:MAG TPA: DNA polymerase III subunit gamma/tau [Deltaproteobacteria bacterium]|nr:MAG: DNA polymerase III, subunit gamma and tau [Deltaproteobacteria bacterium GWA2_55_82]OGQ64995.1 MAG: DNA polymerase III, subunit gamma and tau [Deltaproteobacteria bacterium RIFCSPLOWO2_02_FULL_55_12]OIJ73821.1 MAG: DNA polymerase III, subunit gamma and tau [Deltaproteobacteria bacterium GWC2_55_46]HBG45773.1 DNA polymerase III subunit gamma/tau [Deltaproteobacteria bacterium]HCY09808.1 DNA polymerase III subunit gamma/tau [Deltaproteobacteria bacterium]